MKRRDFIKGGLTVSAGLALGIPKITDLAYANDAKWRTFEVTTRLEVTDPVGAVRAWVPVPLELTHPTAITLLATVITTTPGTVSCLVDDERHEILVHALDCADPAALAAEIKQRYEAPLREIFE